MNFPVMLLVLLALPLITAAVIIAVSSIRRHRHARVHGATEPVHRAQADTAAVQDAAVHPGAPAASVVGGRERRADLGAGGNAPERR